MKRESPGRGSLAKLNAFQKAMQVAPILTPHNEPERFNFKRNLLYSPTRVASSRSKEKGKLLRTGPSE